ncbi:S1C family serine protease, partial [Pseudomonas viridiflava]|uniref:S1C family serine protease n=1 Tax=Pseudomonas viridiflava TaxID=33069 RepID=UPI0019CFA48F
MMVATAGEPNFKLLGSGFICSSKGYFLTSAHLVDLTKPVFIALSPYSQAFPKMHGNKFQFIPAQIVQY